MAVATPLLPQASPAASLYCVKRILDNYHNAVQNAADEASRAILQILDAEKANAEPNSENLNQAPFDFHLPRHKPHYIPVTFNSFRKTPYHSKSFPRSQLDERLCEPEAPEIACHKRSDTSDTIITVFNSEANLPYHSDALEITNPPLFAKPGLPLPSQSPASRRILVSYDSHECNIEDLAHHLASFGQVVQITAVPKVLAGSSSVVLVEYAYASMAWDAHCAAEGTIAKGILSLKIVPTKSYRMNEVNATLLWNKVTRTVLISHATKTSLDALLVEYNRPQDIISSVYSAEDQTCVIEMVSMFAAHKLHQLVQIDAAFVTDAKRTLVAK